MVLPQPPPWSDAHGPYFHQPCGSHHQAQGLLPWLHCVIGPRPHSLGHWILLPLPGLEEVPVHTVCELPSEGDKGMNPEV